MTIPLWSPRFRVEGNELQYKPFPAYPTWLVAWTITGGEPVDTSFPMTPVLYDFNVADVTPSPNFTTDVYGNSDEPLSVISNQVGRTGSFAASGYYNVASFDGDGEVYIKVTEIITGNPYVGLFFQLSGAGSSDCDGYFLEISSSEWLLYRLDDGQLTPLGDVIVQEVTAPFGFGMRKANGVISVYYQSDVEWVQLFTRDDNTHSGGHIGITLTANVRADDIGGGAITIDIGINELIAMIEGLSAAIDGFQTLLIQIQSQVDDHEFRIFTLENP